MKNEINNEQIDDRYTDEALVQMLPKFKNGFADVNGIKLHYVEGGLGAPLILIPGWPETWWSFHKVMPGLSERYHVVCPDLRGMGSSEKPKSGYEKKQMAADIAALIKYFGFQKVNIAGHDIGASVAFSFAADYPELTNKLILIDTPPPDDSMYKLPMLPVPGYPHPWWLAFNQVKVLPEQLLAGRMRYLLDWIFDNLLVEKSSIDDFSRAVYALNYNGIDAIRASNGWYQAFPKDIQDFKAYDKLSIPVLGIAGSGFQLLQTSLPGLTKDLKLVKLEGCGHFIQSENPAGFITAISSFLA
ncbi:alpha/beta fold hydrolase [Mucilaginibacter sp. SP1R1]|uniref:alpha/beta fold hydrolase n=1 Tax=Mucilaginibacter sp. SP1R1 TaxID=2723091 RepID=UPI0016146EFA|nr:alpha/beta hydrolase [Mucilaginibacter sp. SP1R1]MBB6149966.1 pimeloyl-ACP methyl ester carboxylesterase [Mucilaginibacter sp. SP1R1]